MRLSDIVIDVDGSPSGYVAWYNHFDETSKIRPLRPVTRNDRYGVQRMEMLAIYFAIADNFITLKRVSQKLAGGFVIDIRSDSKSTIQQLQGISEIRDIILRRIYESIKKLIDNGICTIIFNHLERKRNIAGLLLEQRQRKEKERLFILNQSSRYRGMSRSQSYGLGINNIYFENHGNVFHV